MTTAINWDEDPYVFVFKDEIPGKVKMHIKNLDLHHWVCIDKTYPKQMAVKSRLYETNKADIFVSRRLDPKTAACKQEFFSLLTEHLLNRFPDIFAKQPNGSIKNKVTGQCVSGDVENNPGEEDILMRAGRLTQEDWIIMELDPEQNSFVLTAGVLCFPSDWNLLEKFNKPMGEIHKPVSVYQDHLKDKVDALFLNMKPKRPLWRANWGIYTDIKGSYDLFTHPSRGLHSFHGVSAPFEGEETGKKLFLRCEYQTLRKLPDTGCIVFGIRTYMRYLEEMKDRPLDEIQSLVKSIKHMDSEHLTYKGGDVWKDNALKYLDLLIDGAKGKQHPLEQKGNILTSRTTLMFAAGALFACIIFFGTKNKIK